MTQLLLIRHGETPLNVARVLQPTDTPLSVRGVEQARAVARRLAPMQVSAIVTSDLPRALHTAELIAAATAAPIDTSELLRERSFGDWRGLAYDTLPANPLLMTDAPPGGESAAAFEARVARAFALVVQRAATLSGGLVVVTHGLVIRAMLATHIRLPAGTAPPAHMGNTGLSAFDARPPHLASLINCTRHLDAATQDDADALSGG
jgi:broad specificity phosphatase PhoE